MIKWLYTEGNEYNTVMYVHPYMATPIKSHPASIQMKPSYLIICATLQKLIRTARSPSMCQEILDRTQMWLSGDSYLRGGQLRKVPSQEPTEARSTLYIYLHPTPALAIHATTARAKILP